MTMHARQRMARVPRGTIALLTRQYINEHPSIRDALRNDLLNVAFLARKIRVERNLANEEAIEIACRRYQQELSSDSASRQAIRSLLSRSRLGIRSRVALVRIREDAEILERLYRIGRSLVSAIRQRSVFQIYQGTRALTVLCEDDFIATLLQALPSRSILHVERGLASVVLRSDPSIAETPGVVTQFAEALFQRGINCLETVSVHADSIFLFRESDVIHGYAALSSLLSAPEKRIHHHRS